jgi:drug/metabolite transporter (DMT)-like permease
LDKRAKNPVRLWAWTALAVVYVVWGSTYLAIRVGVRDLPPGVLSGVRYLIAGSLLYPIAIRTGGAQLRVTDRPKRPQWVSCAAIGILLLVFGNGGVTVAEQRVPSGLAAVLIATVPLWMICFGAVIDRNRISLRAGAGLVIGLAGVALLAGGGRLAGDTAGVVIALGAAASWGLGSALGHQLALPARILLGAAMEMLVAGVVLLVIAACTGEFSGLHLARVGATSWFALAWLILPGSILAFSAYGYALSHLPLSTVSTYAYVNPVVAVALGALLLGEQLTMREAIATVLIVGSVALTVRRRSEPVAEPDLALAEAGAKE